MTGGDLNYLVKEGDKVFCEVTEIVGKDRKKWQTILQSCPTGQVQSVPKYMATMVYIGSGRPKAAKLNSVDYVAVILRATTI